MANLYGGLIVTCVGMILVFAVLSLIAFALSLFKYIFNEKKPETTDKGIEESAEQSIPEILQEQDDLELVAVITTAIAMSLSTSPDQLVVRTYHRVTPRGESRTA